MANSYMPDVGYLHECFDYHPSTGDLLWRERPSHHFRSKKTERGWNAKLAGKAAGTPDNDGYLRVWLSLDNNRRYGPRVHQIAWTMMTGFPPPSEIDHIDMDAGNNRWSNLRLATDQQNQWNKRRYGSLPKGVYYRKNRAKPFSASIVLGSFETPEGAAAAWEEAARRLRGAFFRR